MNPDLERALRNCLFDPRPAVRKWAQDRLDGHHGTAEPKPEPGATESEDQNNDTSRATYTAAAPQKEEPPNTQLSFPVPAVPPNPRPVSAVGAALVGRLQGKDAVPEPRKVKPLPIVPEGTPGAPRAEDLPF
jgi:hypothetical protein